MASRRKIQVKQIPKPLFDTIDNIQEPPLPCVIAYITSLQIPEASREYEVTREFLASYTGSQDTYTSYRREVERLLQWAWLVSKKLLKTLDRNELRRYIEFASQPPETWIGCKHADRFIDREGQRIHNPQWRPFIVRVAKAQRKQGYEPSVVDYQLTNASMQALFASLSTFFTYLQQEGYVEVNPVQLIRQKSQFMRKQQTQKVTRKLSVLQWRTVIESIETLANSNSLYERHLFIISTFYLLGLRISELAETPGRIPCMGDFAPDKHDRWWFSTVGKGNKLRDVAVPDVMLAVLKRYRNSCGLPPLPTRGEQTPLVGKQRGRGGLGTRQIRNLVQTCFDHAIHKLRKMGKSDEAQDLATATVHWLRHTAISADVEFRPREHVRDDVGHQNAAITDRYIDADRIARHESAKAKPLKPRPSEDSRQRTEDR